MKITYDAEVDAMYIELIEGDHECRTVRLTDDIALDFGAGETLVGIEILDAKKVLGRGKLPRIVVDNLPLAAAPAKRGNGTVKAGAKPARAIRKAG